MQPTPQPVRAAGLTAHNKMAPPGEGEAARVRGGG